MRNHGWTIICGVGVFALGLWSHSPAAPPRAAAPRFVANDARTGGATPEATQPSEKKSPRRLREGAEVVDQLGHFEAAAGRLVFIAEDGSGRFVTLENLGLDRVARALSENPDARLWQVSGTVTEYRGTNYLLLESAVLKSRAARPRLPATTLPREARRP